jgi:SHS2 domain-containing protein
VAKPDQPGDRGHAVGPHTADVVIEAWGPTAAACLEEAVAAFVSIFADVEGTRAGSTEAFGIGPGRPEDLLVLLLEEVLFVAEARGFVPTSSRVDVRDDHLRAMFTTVPIDDVEVVGSIPKGISYSGLEFGASDGGWSCRATVDV